jgi:hypothetical protein
MLPRTMTLLVAVQFLMPPRSGRLNGTFPRCPGSMSIDWPG